MSLMAEYFKEKDNKETIENENGFMVYLILGEECYIEHVYIRPEARNKGDGKYFLSVVEARAKKAGCKHITGSVRPSANGSTESCLVMFAVGFKLLSSVQDGIFFSKEVTNG